jgi:hypothetical protein
MAMNKSNMKAICDADSTSFLTGSTGFSGYFLFAFPPALQPSGVRRTGMKSTKGNAPQAAELKYSY